MISTLQIDRTLADMHDKVSRAKRRANRRNARRSTGPRTAEGKSRAARNATTHGVFCREVVLPGEDADRFRETRAEYIRALKPQDAPQLALVDTMVAARWRLDRCLAAEADALVDVTEELAELNCEHRGGSNIDPARDNPSPAAAVASLLREHEQPLERFSPDRTAPSRPVSPLPARPVRAEATREVVRGRTGEPLPG